MDFLYEVTGKPNLWATSSISIPFIFFKPNAY